MRLPDLWKLMAEDPQDVIVVYENGMEEEYIDFFYESSETKNYVLGLKFESFDMYSMDGRRELKIWL